MICKKSWMLQSKSGGIDFLDVSLKNNSTICSSSSAPYYIARCHLGTDIWIHLCLTQFVELIQFDKTMWITHPYHPSKSSKKCQKYVQKKHGNVFQCISHFDFSPRNSVSPWEIHCRLSGIHPGPVPGR